MTTQTQIPTVECHYVTTIQMPGALLNTRSGILTVPISFTRAAAFDYLMNQLKEEYKTTISVLFFSFEPNRLA